METFNLIMQGIGYFVILAMGLFICYVVIVEKKYYGKHSDPTTDDELNNSFEHWLIINHEWNGCGWCNRAESASIVRTTEFLYKEYVSKTFEEILNK